MPDEIIRPFESVCICFKSKKTKKAPDIQLK